MLVTSIPGITAPEKHAGDRHFIKMAMVKNGATNHYHDWDIVDEGPLHDCRVCSILRRATKTKGVELVDLISSKGLVGL